jgi:hypothetical protein
MWDIKRILVFVPVSYVATTMAGVICPTMIGTPPPRAMMYQPFLIQAPVASMCENQQSFEINKCPDHKQPANQTTNIKAELTSIMVMPESSKKVESLINTRCVRDTHRSKCSKRM